MDNSSSPQQLITASSLSAEQKQSLVALVPELPSNSLNFLTFTLKRRSSALAGEALVRVLTESTQLLRQVEAGDISGVASFFQNALTDGDFGSGEYAVPTMLDLLKLIARRKIMLPPPVTDAIKLFRVLCFRYLTQEQQLQVVQSDLIYFLTHGNPLLELKRLYLPEQAAGSFWAQPYQNALLNNQERLGSQPMVLDARKVDPTIKNWLNDFIASSRATLGARSTYEGVRYMSASPNAAGLSKEEQKILMEIFKIYNWLISPLATQDEVQAYDSQYYRYVDTVVLGQAAPAPAQTAAPSFRPADGGSQSLPGTTINMQDVLNRRNQGGGVVFDKETNVQVEEIGQRLEAERQQQQSEIDKKLADLKKRR